MNHPWLSLVILCWLGGMVSPSISEETSTLLVAAESTKANIKASPKFDDRVFVYSAEPLSASILEHAPGSEELLLDVGAKDSVRFGHVFQIVESTSNKWVGFVKVLELEAERSVAKLVSLDKDQAKRSLKNFKAICTEPNAKPNEIIIECRFGKDVWQTESFENKLIRGLLENCGKNVQIRILQENTIHVEDHASEKDG